MTSGARRIAASAAVIAVLAGGGLRDGDAEIAGTARARQLRPELGVPTSQREAAASRRASLGSFPLATRMGLERAVADADPAYRPSGDRRAVTLRSGGGIVAAVTAVGAEARLGGHRVRLEARAIGRASGRPVGLRASTPRIVGRVVELDRGAGAVEWWRSLPSGLEHGITLARSPSGTGEVRVAIDVSGSLEPSLRVDGVALVDSNDVVVASYTDLLVTDARGRELPARFTLDADAVGIAFDDTGATYPVVVDPMLYGEERRLLATDRATSDSLGTSVAMSADGLRVVVGAVNDDDATGSSTFDNGAAYVFVRSGSTWMQEQKLLAPDKAGLDYFGCAVAIADDGSRVVVGAQYEDDPTGTTTSDNGAAYVFARSGAVWTYEQKLLAPDKLDNAQFGFSVGMSGDGSRVVVGAIYQDDATGTSTTDNGAAYVFLRAGAVWSMEQKLLAGDKASLDQFGASVAMSSDGLRVAVGSSNDADSTGGFTASNGSVYVFSRALTVWTQEGKLLATDKATGDTLGASVAISSDGSRIVAGARSEDDATGSATTDNGAAYVFVRSGTAWSQEQKLLAPDKASSDELGSTVAISADGTRVIVGARLDDESLATSTTDSGAAYVFVRTASTWSETQKLFALDRENSGLFGRSVALSGDGVRAVVGAPGEDEPSGASTTNNGVAHVFAVGHDGAPCGSGSDCASGFCTDGVCCDVACGDTVLDDCQACARALTGVPSGTCASLSAAVAPTTVCRASLGGCDPAEACAAGSLVCPADVLSSNGTTCRPSTGVCDPAETCSGSGPLCPADAKLASGTVCHVSTGACDPAETCDGTVGACPTDVLSTQGTVCRPSAGTCDLAEVCNGGSNLCPGDSVASSGIVCRGMNGACDVAETCDGSTTQCPGDSFAASGLSCRPVAGPCDIEETCTGSAPACPTNAFVADGVACDDGLVCTQTSTCSVGVCAPSLTLDCSDSNACTTDVCSEPGGCSHTPIAACGLDAGVDAATRDAASGSDAGGTPTAAGGCSCSVTPRRLGRVSPWLACLSLLCLGGELRRRRRRAHGGEPPAA